MKINYVSLGRQAHLVDTVDECRQLCQTLNDIVDKRGGGLSKSKALDLLSVMFEVKLNKPWVPTGAREEMAIGLQLVADKIIKVSSLEVREIRVFIEEKKEEKKKCLELWHRVLGVPLSTR